MPVLLVMRVVMDSLEVSEMRVVMDSLEVSAKVVKDS
jgi:hypothetical protein